MEDHSEGSSLQNQALQTLQERLHEADAARKREQESCKQMQVRKEECLYAVLSHIYFLIKFCIAVQKNLFLWQKTSIWKFNLILAKFTYSCVLEYN